MVPSGLMRYVESKEYDFDKDSKLCYQSSSETLSP